VIESFFEDVRYAVRSLLREPFLAFVATLTLATCIGANTTVFSVANSILIRPLVYPHSERILWISERSGPAHQDVGVAGDYYALREWTRVFGDVAAFNPTRLNWTGVDRPEQLEGANVSVSFFQVMGTPPYLGRYLAPDEEGPKSPAVAVVSYAFWRNRLGSDIQILGKTIAVDRVPHRIVGVMPQGFDFPRGTQVWLPLSVDKSEQSFPLSPSRPLRVVSILARLKPEVSQQQIETDLNRLTLEIRAEYKAFQSTGFRSDLDIAAMPLQQHLTGRVRPVLLMITGAVGLVQLIACVNLANLLLARAGSRRRERAVRMALGCSRIRIVRQMLTESLVLALPGGLAGIVIAWISARTLNAIKPAILVRYPEISIDLRVLIFTIGLTLATSLLFGMAPALSAAGVRIQETLKSSGLAHSSGRGSARLRKSLVVAELGVSLVLLIAAGLLGRSFIHLARVDLGFPSDHLLTFRVNPIGPFDRDYGKFYEAILERLQQIPVASSAALLGDMPLSDDGFYQSGHIRVVGRPPLPFVQRPTVNNAMVSPDFFHTFEIPLKSGRVFDSHDTVRSAAVVNHGFVAAEPVVVNEALVHRIFPSEDPLGQRIGFGPDQYSVTWTIVGVVGDIRGSTLGSDPPSMVYRCTCAGSPVFIGGFAIRTAGDPKAAIRAVEEQVRAVDRDQPISDVRTMDERREAALAPERFQLILIGSFAVLAIVLAVAGVYGVMSYLVARRTREFGIRVAMGARPADVLGIVIGETTRLVILAIALGLVGAFWLTRYIRSMLYGVNEFDAATYAFTSILLAVVVLIASFGPAHRAVRVDPITALRDE
jgi:putative ABC transport system permease protein